MITGACAAGNRGPASRRTKHAVTRATKTAARTTASTLIEHAVKRVARTTACRPASRPSEHGDDEDDRQFRKLKKQEYGDARDDNGSDARDDIGSLYHRKPAKPDRGDASEDSGRHHRKHPDRARGDASDEDDSVPRSKPAKQARPSKHAVSTKMADSLTSQKNKNMATRATITRACTSASRPSQTVVT